MRSTSEQKAGQKPARPIVLIANPDVFVRAYLERILRRCRNIQLRFAASAEQTLNALSDGCVTVLFIDINMSDVDGLDLLEKIRDFPRFGSIQVVVTGKSGDESDVHRALELDACHFLLKPYCQDLAGKVLERALSGGVANGSTH